MGNHPLGHNLISVLVLTSYNKTMHFSDSVVLLILLNLAAPSVYSYKPFLFGIQY